ncbi:MAG: phosphodiester glycosidase family protein [Hyphomicrobium sp.]|nr:phosphodiester glycosidase family protein [Hyphomicrobium sp.]
MTAFHRIADVGPRPKRRAGRRTVVRFYVAGLLAAAVSSPASATEPCKPLSHAGHGYTICRFDAATDRIRVFHGNPNGTPYRTFDRLATALRTSGETLVFAMNGGMYQDDRRPVGLLVIDGREIAPLNRSAWIGNFYLKPNGVFFVSDGRAGALETDAFREQRLAPQFATQSGPMLVIDGKLHPRFLVDATSRNIRNGVGVSADGREVVFAISTTPVTFHEFGSLFRDALKTPNALYLDGSISRLYAPGIGRNDGGEDMGPIVGVVATPAEQPASSKGPTP